MIVGVLACIFAGFVGLDELAYLIKRRHLARIRDRLHHRHLSFGIRVQTCRREFKTPLFPATPDSRRRDVPRFADELVERAKIRENFFAVYLVLGVVIYFVYRNVELRSSGKGVVVPGARSVGGLASSEGAWTNRFRDSMQSI